MAGPGTLLAFGFNQFGQLGIPAGVGTMGANATPAPVTFPGEVGPVTQVASGFEHTLAITASGQLYAFGNNFFGQLGSPTNANTATPNPTPAPVVLPGEVGPVTQVAAGSQHSLALTASGQLYAFGSNITGQLGSDRNVTTANPNPTPALVVLPGKVGVITQIAAGDSHSLALTSSGQLYAFGSNGLGQLGTGADPLLPHPTPAPVALPGEVGPVTQISAGGSHTLAVTASGQLYAFGDNDDGELGIGPLLDGGESNPVPTPTQVTLPGAVGPVTGVSGGSHHSLALTASGQLYAFGANAFGELGSTGDTRDATPTLVTLPGQLGQITQVVAGLDDSRVVTSSGQLYGFGYNSNGQLGSDANAGTANPNPTPTPMRLAAGTTIDAVSIGPDALHTLALVSDLAIASGSLPPAQVGTPYSATLEATGGTGPVRWSARDLPAGLTIDAASGMLGGTPTEAGSIAATISVTDLYGSASSRPFSVDVAPQATQAVATNAGGGTRPSPGPPRLSALAQSARRWLEGRAPARLTQVAPSQARRRSGPTVGTTFSLSVDRDARLSFAFRRERAGRRVGKRCVSRTASNNGRPSCTRALAAGTLGVQAHTGTNYLRFEGTLAPGSRLAPGNYRVLVTATNAAGTTSQPRPLRFVIAPR